MANGANNIPTNAVQILFAEDLIDRVLYRHTGTHYNQRRAGPYRDFILNAFNEEIQEVVDNIDMRLEREIDEDFNRLVDTHDVNEGAFARYAVLYHLFYFPEGFDPRNFLYYCVRLVSFAAYFVHYNVPRAPDLALNFILEALEGYDMFEGGWDALNNVAKEFLKEFEDYFNRLTPEYSDDEYLADSSDEESDQSEENVVNGDLLNIEDGPVNNQLEISKEEPVNETDDLPATEEGLESTESKRDSKCGVSLERQISSSENLLNVEEEPKISLTPNGEKNGVVNTNSSN